MDVCEPGTTQRFGRPSSRNPGSRETDSKSNPVCRSWSGPDREPTPDGARGLDAIESSRGCPLPSCDRAFRSGCGLVQFDRLDRSRSSGRSTDHVSRPHAVPRRIRIAILAFAAAFPPIPVCGQKPGVDDRIRLVERDIMSPRTPRPATCQRPHRLFNRRAIAFVDRSSFRHVTYRQDDRPNWNRISDHGAVVVEMDPLMAGGAAEIGCARACIADAHVEVSRDAP